MCQGDIGEQDGTDPCGTLGPGSFRGVAVERVEFG
jgi:hypothetical protein